MPYLIETLPGLTPEALDGRLRIVKPLLPDFIHHLEVCHLRVGQAEAHLSFERGPSGKVGGAGSTNRRSSGRGR